VKRDEYSRLPFVSEIGDQRMEFDNPGTKDVYATPLKQEGDAHRREGSSRDFNWSNLNEHLEQMVDEGSDSHPSSASEDEKRPPSSGHAEDKQRDRKKRRIARRTKRSARQIFGIFKGRRGKGLKKPEAEAMGAIMSDLMKGHGAMHFISQAEQATECGDKVSDFSSLFGSSNPLYPPVLQGGRGKVVARTAAEHEAASLIDVNNCLINAIAQASFGRNATFEELVEIRSTLGNVGRMMVANEATILEIRRVLRVTAPFILIIYPETPQERFPKNVVPRHGEIVLRIYNTGEQHFQNKLPNGWHDPEAGKPDGGK
jgi:hypothetical protein